MGIKHRADNGFRKFSSLSKLGFGRTVKCFESPYVSYPRTLVASKTSFIWIQMIYQEKLTMEF